MPSVFQHTCTMQRRSISTRTATSVHHSFGLVHLVVGVAFGLAALAQAQTPAPGSTEQGNRIIVKIKPALAQQIEAEFPATMPVQQMHINPSQTRNARLRNFMTRHSTTRLSPMYPEMIRARKQHGWDDAQFAEHIRQRFPARARRHAQTAVPELSRTYGLDTSAMSIAQIKELVRQLRADAEVEFAEPAHIYSSKQLTNDPFLATSGSWGQPYADLWGLFAINAPTAWDSSTGQGTVVAVVDTGIDYNHPDLAANVWTNPGEIDSNFLDDDGNGFIDDVRGWNFVFGNNDVTDHNGHGTHVAGTIAAVGNNSTGIVGVAWSSHVMAVKGLDDFGNGFDFTLAPAIEYAAANGADVINASWGGPDTSQSIEEAIQFATGLGVVFVAAAGNNSQDAMTFFPSSSPEAITVAASDPFGNFAFFSNFGPKIDTTAPGVDILSLQAAGTFLAPPVIDGYVRQDGTSMAAPHVSGVAALALSQNPGYSTDQVRQIIRSSNTSVPFDDRFGYGKLNAAAAVAITYPLEAKITGLQFASSPIAPITISGVAQGAGFASYLLEYGQGTQPFFWTPFFSSSTPASGTLGALDPSNLFDGTYTIRLTAFNINGNGFVDKTQFTLTLVSITSPAPGTPATYKPGLQLPIIGTASMPGFQNFVVEWSSQDGGTGWQTTGMSLAAGGVTPLANTQLATWDTSAITQAGYYLIRLTVNGFASEQAFATVYLEPDLLSTAWPIFLDLAPCLECPVVPALNPDGTYRLLVESPTQGPTPPASWIIHPDGSFQKSVLSQFGANHQPSAANIDGQPGDEAVITDFNLIDVFHPDNTLDVFTPGLNVFLTNFPVALEDLNNDFHLESITVGGDFNPSNRMAFVFAWKPDGQQASGFPIQVQDNNLLSGASNLTRVIVADFDGDGFKDILVPDGLTFTTYALRLFNHDGTAKSFNVPVLTGIPAAMAAADLDHNGKLELILLNHSDSVGTQATLHVFQPDGSERPGWPVDVTASHSPFYSFSGIAVGDFNRDGHEEIVLSNGSGLYLFNSDGTLFSGSWPLPISNSVTYLRPLIADINGDGLPEIVVPMNDFNSGGLQLRAFHRDGSVVKSWPLTPMNNFLPGFDAAATIGDFNQDGSTDIAVAYGLQALSGASPGVVTILDTHSPFVPGNNDWPMVLQNPRNNPVLLRQSSSTLAVSLTTGATPSVVGDSLVFTATVTPAGNGAVQFLDAGMPISDSIPLSNGSASFSTTALALGTHSITARYTGDNRLTASVSPAFVQTVTKGNTSVAVSLSAGTNPSIAGDSLTFTATVAPGSATGTIVFFDNGLAITGDLPLSNGAASVNTSALAIGTHSITAYYSGDATFDGSVSAALVQTVNSPKASSAVTLALSAGSNPSVVGTSLTFSATVAPVTATGAVTFFDGALPISGAIPLTNNTATFTTSALSGGIHSITARYSGDANFNGSTSAVVTQTVSKLATEVDLELALQDTAFASGTALTFIASVTPANATGSVVFYDGATPVSGMMAVNNGSASFTTSSLSAGTHSITAQYSGDGNFNASISSAHKVTIK
jgi:subtilase family protein/Big-like domain-containing protein/VCBS repeat protein